MGHLISELTEYYLKLFSTKFNDDDVYETENSRYYLKDLSYYNVSSLLEEGYDLHNLLTTPEEINTYKFIIYNCRFKETSIKALLLPFFFLNRDDYDYIKNSLLTIPTTIHKILYDKELVTKLGLIDNIKHYLDLALYDDSYLERITLNWFNYFSDEHKEYIMKLCKIHTSFAQFIIISQELPLQYRIKIFDTCTNMSIDDVKYIFGRIYSTYDILNMKVFNRLISNDINNELVLFWSGYGSQLTVAQQNIIYNKYYVKMFDNSSHWTNFFNYCCAYGQVLRQKERSLVLKRLAATTRAKFIPKAEQAINFTESELIELNTIKLTHKLATK